MATCRTCVAIELSNLAITQYLNWDMAGMIEVDDYVIGGHENGLYKLNTSDYDDSLPINAYFIIPKTDFGSSNQKKMRALFLGFEASGELTATVTVDDEYSEEYTTESQLNQDIQSGKKMPTNASTLKGRYFSLKIENNQGCDFSVDSIDGLILGVVGLDSTL